MALSTICTFPDKHNTPVKCWHLTILSILQQPPVMIHVSTMTSNFSLSTIRYIFIQNQSLSKLKYHIVAYFLKCKKKKLYCQKSLNIFSINVCNPEVFEWDVCCGYNNTYDTYNVTMCSPCFRLQWASYHASVAANNIYHPPLWTTLYWKLPIFCDATWAKN